MVVDSKALIVHWKRPQFTKEGKIFPRVLYTEVKQTAWDLERSPNLLRMLRNQKDQGEVIHSQCGVEQLVGIHQKNGILDSIFDQVWMELFKLKGFV